MDKEIIELNGFWTLGMMDGLYLDRWLYRGKGRPRTSDYSTLATLQRKLNTEMDKRIDQQMLSNSKVEE